MAATAVGLFEDASVAESVVDALRVHGLPSKGIRIFSKPVEGATTTHTITPPADFIPELLQDLHAIGATRDESEAYLARVRDGNVLVFATGTWDQADAAVPIMNQYSALDVEEFASAGPAGSTLHYEESETPRPITSRTEQAKSEGARVFSW